MTPPDAERREKMKDVLRHFRDHPEWSISDALGNLLALLPAPLSVEPSPEGEGGLVKCPEGCDKGWWSVTGMDGSRSFECRRCGGTGKVAAPHREWEMTHDNWIAEREHPVSPPRQPGGREVLTTDRPLLNYMEGCEPGDRKMILGATHGTTVGALWPLKDALFRAFQALDDTRKDLDGAWEMIHTMRSEAENTAVNAIEEHEAKVCPEDFGCAEYIASLQQQLAALRQPGEPLTEQEVKVWAVDCDGLAGPKGLWVPAMSMTEEGANELAQRWREQGRSGVKVTPCRLLRAEVARQKGAGTT